VERDRLDVLTRLACIAGVIDEDQPALASGQLECLIPVGQPDRSRSTGSMTDCRKGQAGQCQSQRPHRRRREIIRRFTALRLGQDGGRIEEGSGGLGFAQAIAQPVADGHAGAFAEARGEREGFAPAIVSEEVEDAGVEDGVEEALAIGVGRQRLLRRLTEAAEEVVDLRRTRDR
jgi:hypothetical protein